ncbi:MAG: ABC transporter substrate-binding protein [Actinomycetota bacterium]
MRSRAYLIVAALTVSGCGSATTATDAVGPADSSSASATEPATAETDTATSSAAADDDDSDTTGDTGPDDASAAPASTSDDPILPVTVTDLVGNEVTVESVERIIPLDGTVAEVVFALGLGDNVVATDLSATYPAEADALPEIGYQRSLTAESIAQFAPTVLLATEIAGPEETIDDLRRLGYPLVIVPNDATADGPAAKVRAVADALGVSARGEALAAELEATIAANETDADADAPVVIALYLRGESTQFVLGEAAATHWLIEAAGGVDAADLLGIGDGAPVNAEAILAIEPDIILVPSAGLDSVGGLEGLMDVGGLGQTPAGKAGAVISHDDQLLLGNGPRTGDLLAELRTAFEELYP